MKKKKKNKELKTIRVKLKFSKPLVKEMSLYFVVKL